jgi:hypothetical protein
MNTPIKDLDTRRETSDDFSFSRSAEKPPSNYNHPQKQKQRGKKKNWRLRHLAEK